MMTSRVMAFCLTLAVAGALAPKAARGEEASQTAQLLAKARAAYEKRVEPNQAKVSVELFEQSIKAGATFEALWEGARAVAYFGENRMQKASRSVRTALYRKGEAWARQAVKLQPNKAAGHFFIAVMLGLRARSQSIFHQMTVAGEIRQRAERAVKLDPNFECAGPLRMLGQYFLRLPEFFGGDNHRAAKLLEQGAKLCPGDLENHVVLAEAFHAIDQDERARRELRWVLDHPPTDPEDRESYKQLKQQAQEFLEDWD